MLLVLLKHIEECASLLEGVAQFESTHEGWDVFLDERAQAEADHSWLRSRHWDGVISRFTTPAFAKLCGNLGIPLVDLNDSPRIPNVPKIRPDNVAVGHLGAEHFLERGFRSFGFCGFVDRSWSWERRDGFIEALRLAGFGCEVFDVAHPPEFNPDWDARQVGPLARWLAGLRKPAAVMTCFDLRASQVIGAARQAGLSVPEDVAVLGVNNQTSRVGLSSPPLSSVALHPFRAGFHAADMLSALMNGRKITTMDLRIEPAGVVARRSSDLLAIQDHQIADALKYIRDHACQGLTVADVLRHTSISRSQLEKRFRRYLGRTPQGEIRRVQIARIKQMLSETDLSLDSVAEAAGFTHPEYMSVVFKRLCGESPGAFRRRRDVLPHTTRVHAHPQTASAPNVE